MVVLDELREQRLLISKIGMLRFLVDVANVGSVVSIKVVAFGNVHIVLFFHVGRNPTGTEGG